MTEVQEKFIKLLKDMFQFDQADLDFGIYRIMNAKHDEIANFLDKELPAEIDKGLQTLESSAAIEQIKKIEEQIVTAKSMDLDQAMKDSMIAKLEEQKAKLNASTDFDSAENEIYNNLLDFFSRYYDDGDFISQRRYSKGKYAIPYEGEEVKLHWANADQYYIKTSEYFKDYSFSDQFGNKAHFKILDAETEQNNNKSKDKRFFQLTSNETKFEVIDGELYIYVEYKAGTQKTQKPYTQEILESFTDFANSRGGVELQPFVSITIKEKGADTSFLEKQLNRYTAKNTFDYFIHKDLKKFLNQELDFFIKNEVIKLDDIDENDEAKTKLILTKAKVLRTIAKEIITFLAQIEDFQKKLFLKKKFVTETNYCITLDRIDESFYPEIAANEEQRKEWVKLFAIDEIKATSGDLLSKGKTAYSEPLTVDFLKENPYLVLDTAFFSEDVKEKIVAGIDQLDENLDGLLIHGDNIQSLNLLQSKYNSNISCIYIDPPYNTGPSEILYKNNYKDSSWLSLMNSRLEFAKRLMTDDCAMCVAIDDYAMVDLAEMLDCNFTGYQRDMVIVNHHPQGTPKDNISRTHEYAIIMTPEGEAILENRTSDEEIDYRALMRSGTAENNYRYGRPNSFYAYLVDKNFKKIMGIEPPPEMGKEYPREDTKEGWKRIYPLSKDGTERVWRISFNSEDWKTKKPNDMVKCSDNFSLYQIVKGKKVPINSNWTDKRYNAGTYGTTMIHDIMGDSSVFSYPKSLYTVEDYIKAVSKNDNGEVILDFFAGSATTGHAVIDLNRDDGINRKYILCEMGEYFDTVTKPRVQKVIYSKDWKDGKPVSREGSSHAFKYIRLESYEDTLNNIVLNSPKSDLLDSAKKDYMLNYMMDFESKDSDSLLNIEKLSHPFDYKMKITRSQQCKEQKIDLVETFNYLIGLNVVQNGATQVYDATFTTDASKPLVATLKPNGSTYRIKMIEGTNRAGDRVLVIWRELTGDIEKDNAVLDAFFAKKHVNPLDFEYKTIYVNGDNNLQNVKTEDENWKVVLIESEMKKRMFSER